MSNSSPSSEKQKSVVYSLRLPEELKNRCEILSESKGISLNEWIKRTLSVALDEQNDSEYQTLLRVIDKYVSQNNDFDVKTRRDFIMKSAIYVMTGCKCSKCGAFNPAGAMYCNICGELPYWIHEDTQYAGAYMNVYEDLHPIDEGWEYKLVLPTEENKESGFFIFKMPTTSSILSKPIFVKKITDKDIAFGKTIYNRSKNTGGKCIYKKSEFPDD